MRLNRWGLATIMPFWMIARSRYFRPRPVPSQAKFTVRTEAYKLQDSVTGLPVDQHQVGLDVAVSMISPFAGQSVVTLLSAQRLILGKHLQDFNEVTCERHPVRAAGFTLVVALELAGTLNPSHSNPPSIHRRS